MKLALVSARATTRVAELAAAMSRRGHQVSVYTRRVNSDDAERFRAPEGYTVCRAPAGPAEQIEHSKERLARDLVTVKARWGGIKGEAEHTARSVAIAAAAAVTVLAVGAVAAVAMRSGRKRRRIWW